MAFSSRFEVVITPPKKRDSDGDETPVLDFRPFSSVPKVIFKNISVGNSASRSIVLRNPQSQLIEVELVKLPPQDVGLSFSEKKIHLQPRQEAVLMINWQPKKEGKCIHSVHLKTNTNSRHHFSIVCVSINKKPLKKTGKAAKQRAAVKKKVMLKSLTGSIDNDKEETKIDKGSVISNKAASQIPTYSQRNKFYPKISEELKPTNIKSCLSSEKKSINARKTDAKCVEFLETEEDLTNFSSETYDLGSPDLRSLQSPDLGIVSNAFQSIKSDDDFLSDIGFSPVRATFQKASRETYVLVPKVSFLSRSNMKKLESLPETLDMSSDSLSPNFPPQKGPKSSMPGTSVIPQGSFGIDSKLQTVDQCCNDTPSKVDHNLNFNISNLLEVEDLIRKKHMQNEKDFGNLELEISDLAGVENLLAQKQMKPVFEIKDQTNFIPSSWRMKEDFLGNELTFLGRNDPSFHVQLPKENNINCSIPNLLEDESLLMTNDFKSVREVSKLELDISDLTEAENMLAKKYREPNGGMNIFEQSLPPITPLNKVSLTNENFSEEMPQNINEQSFGFTQVCYKSSLFHSFQMTPLNGTGNRMKPIEVTDQTSMGETSQTHISFSTPFEKHLSSQSEAVMSVQCFEKKEKMNYKVEQRFDIEPQRTLSSVEISPICKGQNENSSMSMEIGENCSNVFKEPKAKISLTYAFSKKPFTTSVERNSCRSVNETNKSFYSNQGGNEPVQDNGMEAIPKCFNNNDVSSNTAKNEGNSKISVVQKDGNKCLIFSPPCKLGHSQAKENISPSNIRTSKRDQRAVKQVTPFQVRRDSVQQVLRESQRKKQPLYPISKLTLSSKVNKSSQKKRIMDPDRILSGQSNPSYCITSTTINPFLNSAVYYDQQWYDARANEFVRWLNVLLTPPKQLSSSDELPKVDVADLWKRSCKADVAPAPSRETVSSLYLVNHRLDSLRRKAWTMFCLPSVAQVLSKVVVQIEKGILSVRKDRNIVRDIGLKCFVVELLLCYNPLWLRIGLETIMGRTIPLESNSDVVGITGFIARNILSDPYLVQQYSYSGVTNMFKPGYEEAVKKYILKKFFLLVFFLDYAKENKLIVHNPCLFCKDAQYKESRDLLLAFAREFLAGIGDVTKHLKCLGYVVKHKQTYLDEFNYAVTHLGSDLRDGIRLTKVAETILQKSTLSSTLRTPPISKLQKMHNVKVSLQALCDAGHKIEGDISAKDIVEGHKEKTMSLLWQIIYRFQLTRFTSAANKIEKWYRSLSVCINRRIWLKKEASKRRLIEDKASTVIQKHWRSYIARMQYKMYINSICKLQKWFKSVIIMRCVRAQFLRKREAAVKIQRFVRQKNNYVIKQIAAVKIQHWYRSIKVMHHDASVLQKKKTSVRIIQCWFRNAILMRQQKAMYQKMRLSAMKIQIWVRATMLMKKERKLYLAQMHAALKIQSTYRALILTRQERDLFILKRNSAVTIQRWYRTILLTNFEQQSYLRLKHATITIQRWWRSICLARQLRYNFLLERKSAINIQKWYQAILCMREQRKIYLQKQNAAMKIQKWYRSIKVMHHDASVLQKKKTSVRIIQCWFRNAILMRQQKAMYQKMRLSAMKIQIWVRATMLMKKERKLYLAQKHAALKIQSTYRALILTRQERDLFILKRNSAVTIQRWYRTILLMNFGQQSYLRQKQATVSIQRWWRSLTLAKTLRLNFIAMRQSALKIQRWFRSVRCMRKQRRCYISIRKAAITIQRKYRVWQLEKQRLISRSPEVVDEAQLKFLKFNACAIKIQARWRGYITRRRLTAAGISSVNFGTRPELDMTRSSRALYNKAIQDFSSTTTTYGTIINAAYVIESCVRIVPELCDEFLRSQHLETVVNLMITSNRSVPAEKLLVILVRTLTHIIRHTDGLSYLMKIDDFLPTLITLTNIWNGKRNEILFCALCTVWWLLAQNPDLHQLLSEMEVTSHLVKSYRKVKIWTRDSKSVQSSKAKHSLPTRRPTWYLGSGDRTLCFLSGLFAITEVLKLFKISVNQL